MFGVCAAGVMVTMYALVMESLGVEHRMLQRCFVNWGVNKCIFTLIHYLFPYWRTAVLVQTLVGAVPLLLLFVFVIPESVVWLADADRHRQLRQAKSRVNWINGHRRKLSEADEDVKATTRRPKEAAALKFLCVPRSVSKTRATHSPCSKRCTRSSCASCGSWRR